LLELAAPQAPTEELPAAPRLSFGADLDFAITIDPALIGKIFKQ
jgi:hypothetical protein